MSMLTLYVNTLLTRRLRLVFWLKKNSVSVRISTFLFLVSFNIYWSLR